MTIALILLVAVLATSTLCLLVAWEDEKHRRKLAEAEAAVHLAALDRCWEADRRARRPRTNARGSQAPSDWSVN